MKCLKMEAGPANRPCFHALTLGCGIDDGGLAVDAGLVVSVGDGQSNLGSAVEVYVLPGAKQSAGSVGEGLPVGVGGDEHAGDGSGFDVDVALVSDDGSGGRKATRRGSHARS